MCTINIIVGDGLRAVPLSHTTHRMKNRRADSNLPVIAPKGTRRQINESRYAAVARSEATRQSVLIYTALNKPQSGKEKRIPTTSDIGHWSWE